MTKTAGDDGVVQFFRIHGVGIGGIHFLHLLLDCALYLFKHMRLALFRSGGCLLCRLCKLLLLVGCLILVVAYAETTVALADRYRLFLVGHVTDIKRLAL